MQLCVPNTILYLGIQHAAIHFFVKPWVGLLTVCQRPSLGTICKHGQETDVKESAFQGNVKIPLHVMFHGPVALRRSISFSFLFSKDVNWPRYKYSSTYRLYCRPPSYTHKGLFDAGVSTHNIQHSRKQCNTFKPLCLPCSLKYKQLLCFTKVHKQSEISHCQYRRWCEGQPSSLLSKDPTIISIRVDRYMCISFSCQFVAQDILRNYLTDFEFFLHMCFAVGANKIV